MTYTPTPDPYLSGIMQREAERQIAFADKCEQAFRTAAARLGMNPLDLAERLQYRGIAELYYNLSDQHSWHLGVGTLGIPDGEGKYVEIDMSSEYCDSALFEKTDALLRKIKP